MNTVTERDWIYAAGIMDGEGWVYIDSSTMTLKLGVCMKTSEVVNWLHETFGGKLYFGQTKHGGDLRWNLFGKNCLVFLQGIEPFCKTKRNQVKVGIAFARTINQKGVNHCKSSNLRTQVERIKLSGILSQLNQKRAADPNWVPPEKREAVQ